MFTLLRCAAFHYVLLEYVADKMFSEYAPFRLSRDYYVAGYFFAIFHLRHYDICATLRLHYFRLQLDTPSLILFHAARFHVSYYACFIFFMIDLRYDYAHTRWRHASAAALPRRFTLTRRLLIISTLRRLPRRHFFLRCHYGFIILLFAITPSPRLIKGVIFSSP